MRGGGARQRAAALGTLLALLCVVSCIGTARAEDKVSIAVGEMYNISTWGADNNMTFVVTGVKEAQMVMVAFLRRKAYYYATSRMYLVRYHANNDTWAQLDGQNYTYEQEAGAGDTTFMLVRDPRTYDTEVPITIKVCNNTCAFECPEDCAGSGGCDKHYHTCSCDTGYILTEGSCAGQDMTSSRIALIVCMTLLAVVVVLVIVGLLFYFCEKKAPRPKSA